jgi:hypothetical protein
VSDDTSERDLRDGEATFREDFPDVWRGGQILIDPAVPPPTSATIPEPPPPPSDAGK